MTDLKPLLRECREYVWRFENVSIRAPDLIKRIDAALSAPANGKPCGEDVRAALVEIDGCFEAAYAEGLADRLAEQEIGVAGSLRDLIERRLLPAREAAIRALDLSKINAVPQAPCTPCRSSPGLAERPDSTNGISHEPSAAILDETDSGVKPVGMAPLPAVEPASGRRELVERLRSAFSELIVQIECSASVVDGSPLDAARYGLANAIDTAVLALAELEESLSHEIGAHQFTKRQYEDAKLRALSEAGERCKKGDDNA